MGNHRAVIEWQRPGDAHWFASGAIILSFEPPTLAAVRQVVPAAQGFPFPGLSAVALAEADTAIHSTATLMTHEQVKEAEAAYQAKEGAACKELRQILRLMDGYAGQGMVSRFVFWESLAGSPSAH
jgi:hypothetical protein